MAIQTRDQGRYLGGRTTPGCPVRPRPIWNVTLTEGRAWSLTTVRAILSNPRYTGRQVWNRQPTDHDLIDPANTGLGHRQIQRWSLPADWVISTRAAHQALISEADFIAFQGMRAAREDAEHRYLLAGLLRCGVCGRRLESCWVNNRAAYRCRHGHTSSARRDPDRPKNLYVREDRILTHLPALNILLNETDSAEPSSTSADVISHLRTHKIALVYDPQTRALQADNGPTTKIIIGRTG